MTGKRAKKLRAGDRMPDGSVYAGISPDTGKPLFAAAADAPLRMAFNEAKKYAQKLDLHGHKDWRLPTKDELSVLFKNRASIGGFERGGSASAGWYWSSSLDSYGWLVWVQRFSNGQINHSLKDIRSPVRCVR